MLSNFEEIERKLESLPCKYNISEPADPYTLQFSIFSSQVISVPNNHNTASLC